MSQLSIGTDVSSCSVPPEIVFNQDSAFISEIEAVDELYYSKLCSTACNDDDSYKLTYDDLSSDSESEHNYDSDVSVDENDKPYIASEPCDSDNIECIAQAKFRNDTCMCKQYGGEPCSYRVDLELESAFEFREHCHQLTRDELDITIKAELYAHRRSGSHTQAKQHKEKERERPFQEFYFHGLRVCRTTFCFIHGISKNTLNAISKSLDTDGLVPRKHGNVARVPHNSLTVSDRQQILTFLKKYASDNALPLPGRLPNYRSEKVLLLPSDTTSVDIYDHYDRLAKEMNYRRISLRTFQRTWHDLCPYITIMKPCTDLCQLCQIYTHKISTSGVLNDEQKRDVLLQYTQHVEDAKQQRDHYRNQCNDSKELFTSMPAEKKTEGNLPCSVDGSMHYSWDYAQQVHYPHQAQQVGPIFFKTPRKCSVFGICSEGSGKQVFYLVDEAESNGVGKGANSVVSMAHHYFEEFGHGEKAAGINFDNCSGQNKNNIVIWYALWRVIVGLHNIIQYSMMVAGHTKFDPDWHFGVWKCRWRMSNADTLQDVADTVRHSSRNGHNVPQLVKDSNRPVIFRDWKSYLKQFFKPLKHLNKYHHFIIDSSTPGVVVCKELQDSPCISFNLLKKKDSLPTANEMPREIVSSGLDPARQWYLYENIREFCMSERSKDLTCPKPDVPRPRGTITGSENVNTCKRKTHLLR